MTAINEKGILGKFLVWRVRYIKEKQFIVMLSILVGIVTGLAGVVLKNMVHFTHMFFTARMQVDSGNLFFFISVYYTHLSIKRYYNLTLNNLT